LSQIFSAGFNSGEYEALLINGLAWHYRQYSKSNRLAALGRQARDKKVNIWSMPNPVPPWDYRRNK
jgi:endonuclease YncB( thermonuclease family)